MNRADATPAPRELFGQVAVRKGFLSQQQVREALAQQSEIARNGAPHRPIGMVLLDMGSLGTTELIDVLQELNLRPAKHKTTRRFAN